MTNESADDVVGEDPTEGKFTLVTWRDSFPGLRIGVVFDYVAIGTDGFRVQDWLVAFLFSSEESANGCRDLATVGDAPIFLVSIGFVSLARVSI